MKVTHRLLSHGDLPVVNENDAISHEEIAHGDNDQLAARLASKIAASDLFKARVRLVVLSNIDGVYDGAGAVCPEIVDIDKYLHLAEGAISTQGTGGMGTKLEAAQIARTDGVEMWIANGRSENAIQRTLAGEIGTHFSIKS